MGMLSFVSRFVYISLLCFYCLKFACVTSFTFSMLHTPALLAYTHEMLTRDI